MVNNSCFIVLNYNGVNFLENNLSQVFKQCSKSNIDFFVGDDNSSDGSIEYLQKNDIQFFINKNKNKGYAANLNNVLKRISNSSYSEFIVSNSDIELPQDFFEQYFYLINKLRKIKKWGLLGFTESNTPVTNNHALHESRQIKKVKNINGFLYTINKDLINEIGFFDEEYFMYGEDNDYFYRTTKAGYKIFESSLKIFHYSEGSKSNNKQNSWLAYRNSILFAKKNLNLSGTLKLILSLIHIIYNPFYKKNDPSVNRLRRSGFINNHKMLIRSIIWNLNKKL